MVGWWCNLLASESSRGLLFSVDLCVPYRYGSWVTSSVKSLLGTDVPASTSLFNSQNWSQGTHLALYSTILHGVLEGETGLGCYIAFFASLTIGTVWDAVGAFSVSVLNRQGIASPKTRWINVNNMVKRVCSWLKCHSPQWLINELTWVCWGVCSDGL